MTPKIIEEKKLWKQGYRCVACIDEVGRGPLAGPVVAAAVCFIPKENLKNLIRLSFPHLRDSKKLSPKRREEIYKKAQKHSAIQWGIGKVSHEIIDKINIYNATKLAMKNAFLNLKKKLHKRAIQKNYDRRNSAHLIDFAVVDGNMKLTLPVPYKSIVKADEKVFSCALASIIAKVTRDRMMARYHTKYPQYGFDRHKGYGTALHMAMLKKHGPCIVHRKTFQPIAQLLNG
jgi:ribonuclease HII